jgi:hypothetical protein
MNVPFASPAPFFRTRQCLGQTHRPTPVTAYPGVHLTAARTNASCSDWHVLIYFPQ